MRAFLRAAAFGAVALAAACKGRVDSDTRMAPVPALPTSSDTSLGVVRTCCPLTNADLLAMDAEFERTPPAERRPELAVLRHRWSNGIFMRTRAVVTDAQTWADLWDEIMRRSSPPPVPRVNFDREMLIVVGMGTRPTSGYWITIDSVRAVSDRVRVFVTEWSPGPRCGLLSAFSQPLGLARLRRVTLPLVFVEHARTFDCDRARGSAGAP